MLFAMSPKASISSVVRQVCFLALALAVAACESGSELSGETLNVTLREVARGSQQVRDYAAAISYYRSLYQRNPSDLESGLGLARNLRYAGENGEALEVAKQLAERLPQEPRIQLEQGKTLLAIGRPAEALELLSKIEPAMPDSWDLQVTLGVAYDRLGLTDLARAAYQRAMLLSPDNPTVLNNYGLSRAQQGDLGEATNLVGRAAAQPGATPAMRQNMALLHALKGEMGEAERLVRQDLPPEVARANIAYLRSLSEAVQREPSPRVPAAPPLPVRQEPLATPAEPPPATSSAAPAAESVSAAAAAAAAAPGAPTVITPPAEAPAAVSPAPAVADSPAAEAPASSPAPPASTPKSNEVLAQQIFGTPAAAPLTPFAQSEYVVQLGSYNGQASATAAMERVRQKQAELLQKVDVAVVEIPVGSGHAWRVLARPEGDRAAAVRLCGRLKARGTDCLARRRQAGE